MLKVKKAPKAADPLATLAQQNSPQWEDSLWFPVPVCRRLTGRHGLLQLLSVTRNDHISCYQPRKRSKSKAQRMMSFGVEVDRISQSSGWPHPHCVAEDDFELLSLLPPRSCDYTYVLSYSG